MCDPAHRPAVASGSDHPPARANDVLLPLGHAHSFRTLGGVGKCDHAATKLTIFNVWVLLKKKKKFAGPSASCQTLSSRSTLASPPRGLCTALPLPATAFPSGPSGPQSSLSHGTALSVLCPPRPALSHSPVASLSAHLLSVSSVAKHGPRGPGRCFCPCCAPASYCWLSECTRREV